ncbi:alpha/beta fold hydrolase [Pseudoalteromonas fenneropenaei]|uniref:Proline iminopeptidase n=1 Tax=Pseudoalteromonas fenneropenaei TaxID=1737459 RepID=A0ABV7CPF6_9GAMM
MNNKVFNRISRLSIALLPLIGSYQALATDLAKPQTPELTPCYAKGMSDRLLCGSIMRPISENPQDGEFALHFTIIPAIKNAHPDEMVLAFAGGPGQSATEIAGAFNKALHIARQKRAILLVDQRGTGKSKLLQCDTPSLSELMAYADDPETLLADVEQESKACLAQLQVDLSHFTTPVAAADFEAVREYLAVKGLHLYGGSYGTRIAQEYARQYPAHVKTMTLDGVVPMQQSLLAIGTAVEEALAAVFRDCEQDSACHASYPTLQADYQQLMAKLAQETVTTQVLHPRTGEQEQFVVSANKLYSALRMALYSKASRALIPLTIYQANKGNYSPLLGLMSGNDVAEGIAMGMHNSIVCGEDWPLYQQNQAAYQETVSTPLGGQMMRTLSVGCEILQVKPVDKAFYQPLSTDIPTLLLSGGLDPATPPSWAELAMVKMTNAKHFVAQGATHIVAMQSCADKLVGEFIDSASTEKIDASCLDKQTHQQFFLNIQSVEALPSVIKE